MQDNLAIAVEALNKAKKAYEHRCTAAELSVLVAWHSALPMWVNGLDGTLVWKNQAYIDAYGEQPVCVKHDREVLSKDKSLHFYNGGGVDVIKWPIHNDEGDIVGIAGTMIDESAGRKFDSGLVAESPKRDDGRT